MLADLSGLSVTVYDVGGNLVETSTFPDFQRNNLFLDEIRAFMRALQGESTPLVSLADGIQSLRMALAARESLASGKVIKLKRN
jgi:predicted dehydrogenase